MYPNSDDGMALRIEGRYTYVIPSRTHVERTPWCFGRSILFHFPVVVLPDCDEVSLQIQAGVTAILGPSGSGKTSLLNLLVGFERPSSGEVVFHGASTTRRLDLFWAPPQQGLWPHLSVREHLTTVSTCDPQHAIAEANRLLEKFDLLIHADARPDTLSLGERSRLNVARALCSQAAILVMDEPLSHVDLVRSQNYWKAIRDECAALGTSLIFSTHSPDVVLREASQVVCLADGCVTYCGDVIRPLRTTVFTRSGDPDGSL